VRQCEILEYARETEHEKIIRGVAVGLALILYAREEEADPWVEKMSTDKDALIRYGGMYALGMAYAGTGNNKAIRQLLHFAVSDVSDDVRRAAVISIGFLLFRRPHQTPSVVQLLSESYNPHVRFGAMLALGIACAGTGLQDGNGFNSTQCSVVPLCKQNVKKFADGCNASLQR
jgi:26S proteasome regulatory subunit N2